ncbi:type II toxin-antitoxin system RelE/ParE family toxin [Duganella radicis]|uniref:Type II toxin-antitoxin system mRNA interferase toxin, RelE/StbE family n=1 Tax=Duganella radicis TaxID=551988 RepID=A0A6L6PQU0_9BURK|nr:type II toxin-antitoxin system RelE/ParE family toxin [Duganella radicis]MTV41214.1 type II toxin-antitoxin system mRNA interferase toxin, RelE/StbE family [Duganella radicis]
MNARWTRRAAQDRKSLFDYIEQRSVEGAISTDEEIRKMATLIADFPHLGHQGRVSGTFEFDITKQIVLVYRLRPRLQVVEFLRVIHTRRDFP